ncbi:MAG: hypothetical protein IT480_02345 [Gammaproteobacteria bacterium]|nr:hypothetical protein [Gammaproteobacteria bacterium]
MATPSPAERPRGGAWYREPVVWLGIAVFGASIAGCAWLIAISARYDDARLPIGKQVFGIPAQPVPAGASGQDGYPPATSASR